MSCVLSRTEGIDYVLLNIFIRDLEENIKSTIIMKHDDNAVPHLARKKRI